MVLIKKNLKKKDNSYTMMIMMMTTLTMIRWSKDVEGYNAF